MDPAYRRSFFGGEISQSAEPTRPRFEDTRFACNCCYLVVGISYKSSSIPFLGGAFSLDVSLTQALVLFSS